MSTPDDLMSASMIAAEYGIARKTIQRWGRTSPPRLLPTLILPGITGAHLFKRSDVEDAMARYKQRAGTEEPAPATLTPESELDQLLAEI